MRTDRAKYSVLAVERALSIIKSFNAQRRRLGYLDAAELTGIPSSTAYKLMQLLLQEGFLEQDPDSGDYRIGRQIFRLGDLYLADRSLVESADRWLRELVERLGFTTSLGVRDGDSVVTILTRPGSGPLSLTQVQLLGERTLLYHSAQGKALILDMRDDDLSQILPPPPWPKSTANSISSVDELKRDLHKARRRGCTRDDEESSIGVRCVGVPVRNHEGRVVAAISVTATTIEITEDTLPHVEETVKEIGSRVSACLGSQAQ